MIPRLVSAPRTALLAPPGDLAGARLARLLGVPLWEHAPRALRMDLIHVRAPVADLRRAAWRCTLAGARAVVVTPLDAPQALGWWERCFHRYVLPSQDEARAWCGVGIALGRIVVVEPGPDDAEAEALAAVYAEVVSMKRRAG